MEMKLKITFLTPTFLYGADQTRPEFRIRSLLGQMRYWWRMTRAWPKSKDSAQIEEMRENEAKVFGLGDKNAKPFYLYVEEENISTCKAEEKHVSFKLDSYSHPTSLKKIEQDFPKLSYNNKGKLSYKGFMTDDENSRLLDRCKNKNWKKAINELYNSRGYVFTNDRNGLAYLFFSFNQSRKEIKDRPFWWIAPGSSVTLNLDFVKDDFKDDVLLSLFLLSRFGGLGSRSRRGAGAVEIKVEGCDLFEKSAEDFQNHLNGTAKDNGAFSHEIDKNSPIYNALTNTDRCLLRAKQNSAWEKTLEPVGREMNQFRTTKDLIDDRKKVDEDFQNEATDLHDYFADPNNNNPPKKLTKDAFGLPRIVNFSHGGSKSNAITVAPYNDPDKKLKMGRRASPLHLTVNREKNGQGWDYYTTAIILWGHTPFLPDDYPARLRHNVSHKDDKTLRTDLPELGSPGPEKLEKFLERL